jgi:hypothetical protein
MAQPSRGCDALPMFDRVDALPARSGDDDQSRAERIRKLAARRGLLLVRSARRDPVADEFQGWWLVDAQYTNLRVAGGKFGMSLDETEVWLNNGRSA